MCPVHTRVSWFAPDDADVFFGREQLVEELVGRLDESAFLAVVGPSGSGKSSLVRAGVVPALRRRNETLRVALFSPGEHPLAELAPARDAGLLVIDQFEEAFTLCRDEEERREFIERLLDAAERGTPVLVALRADFYGHCATYPRLAAAFKHRQELVGPMSEEELRRAIEGPAQHAGLVLEPGLVEAVLRDVVGEPGAAASPLAQPARDVEAQKRSDADADRLPAGGRRPGSDREDGRDGVPRGTLA
jgi:Novel STAND NTPase 1